jgi:hypothetical protein
MYNWSTDEENLKKYPREHQKWRLLQLINFGLDGEKIDLKMLKKYWQEIKGEIVDEKIKEYIEKIVLY